MSKLPSEILKVIFDHLHYTQKLRCKLVCRDWANALQSGSDIESVAIPFRWDDSTGSYVSLPLIEKVQNGILSGENCRQLILLDYSDRALLAKLFPNLKLIHFLSQESSLNKFTSEQIGYLQNWHKSLETYLDSSCDEMALSILESGVFQKLTTIRLVDNLTIQVELTTIADKLKNAPNLKSLDLKAFQADIIGLEKLHSNVPCLESLVLRHCVVELPRELSKVIQPAKTMREFALIECDYADGFTMTLSQYIVRTYSSLERFSLIIDDEDYVELNDLQQNPIHHTIKKLARNLQTLNTNAFYQSSNSLIELTNNSPFLEVLTTDLRKKMSLFIPILESNTLTNTLRSLSLYRTPSLNFKLFNQFIHLKQLCLAFEHAKVDSRFFDLDIIMNSLPKSLDTLELEYVGLDLSPAHVNDNSIHSIKSLTMKNCKIKSDLSGYLSHCFPELKTLVIADCETEFHLELPNHHLSFVEFYLLPYNVVTTFNYELEKGIIPQHPRLFKLTTGNISTFYEYPRTLISSTFERWNYKLFDKHDHFQYDINTPSTIYREENDLHYFHFRCASVQTLLLNKELLL